MLRNGTAGYGSLTKVLHWLTVVVLLAQLTVGYALDADDGGGRGRGRGRGRGGDPGRGRGRGGDDAGGYDVLDDRLLTLHVALGASIIVLVVVRVAWRRIDGLPPWADRLGPRQRTVATWTERALLAALVAMPASGIVLVVSGEDDLLWLHVATHVMFFAALGAHLALVLGTRLLPRML